MDLVDHAQRKSIHMAILNSFYSLALPFVLIFSLPLAIFAAITSTFAISILLFRFLLIYAELAVAIIPYYLLGLGHENKVKPHTKTSGSRSPAAVRRHHRRNSSSSAASDGLTPVASNANFALMSYLNTSVGPQRDFEGVGGWRLEAPEEEDALWTSINSRLELPADHIRRHRRSLTSGSYYTSPRSYSPEKERLIGMGPMAMMEPNTSKARTPLEISTRERDSDAYFGSGSQTPTPKTAKRMTSAGTTASGSSGSSKGSVVNMTRM